MAFSLSHVSAGENLTVVGGNINYYGPPGLQAAALVSGYRVTVDRFAPDELLDREDELARLATFCRGDQPYWWWQAGPWSGKTGLLAWFALHPPDDIDVVCFFIRAAIDTENSLPAYRSIVLPQLAVLTGDQLRADLAGPDQTNTYQDLLNKAAQHAQDHGRRLALIIDGLDEDKGSPSIVSQLPNHPHPALRIILASRATPDVLSDIKDDHPLHNWTKTALTPSPHARGIGQQAEAELQRLLSGEAVQRDLIGFIAAAGGGLTISDLAELTNQPRYLVRPMLVASHAGRSLTPHTLATTFTFLDAHDDIGYVLAHQELTRLAVDELGPQLAVYRDKIHAWAQQYGADHWPATTPSYLLLEYPALLERLQDAERLQALVKDTSRRERLFERTGGDAAALNEIAFAVQLLADQPEPDLAEICLLTRQQAQLTNRNEKIPHQLLRAWIRMGHIKRAYAAAQSKPAVGSLRAEALSAVAEAVALTGDTARAQAIADTITDEDLHVRTLTNIAEFEARHGDWDRAVGVADSVAEDRRAEVLSAIAEVGARNGDLSRAIEVVDRAKEIADAIITRARKLQQLAAVAAALAWTGEVDRAIGLARTIAEDGYSDEGLPAIVEAVALAGDVDGAQAIAEIIGHSSLRAQALSSLAQIVAQTGDIDRAEAITDEITVVENRAQALVDIARIEAEAGDSDRATTLTNRAEAAALSIEGDYIKCWALAAVTAGIAQIGDFDRALALAHTIITEQPSEQALLAIAEAVARTGDINRAQAITDTMDWYTYQNQARSTIAQVVARTGDTARAEAIADTITDDLAATEYHAEALSKIAEVVAQTGDTARAERLIATAIERLNRRWNVLYHLQALGAIAEGMAETGDINRAETLAHSIVADYLPDSAQYFRFQALRVIVEAVAKAGDLDRAQAIADTIEQGYIQARALAAIAEVAAEAGRCDRAIVLADRAEAIAHNLEIGGMKFEVLTALAAVIARTGDFDDAIALTDRIEAIAPIAEAEYRKSEARAAVAAVIARTGNFDRAIELAHTITNTFAWSKALIAVAEALAKTGDRDRATTLADGAELTANAITDDYFKSAARAAAAGALAWAGDTARAEAAADTITDDDDHAQALAAVAAAEAEAGKIDRAIQLTNRARSLVSPQVPATVANQLTSVAEVLGRAGYLDQVEDIARSLTAWPTCLQNMARQLAVDGHHQSAVRVLARAWIFGTWDAPLQVLVTVDQPAAHRVIDEISRNLEA